MNFLQTTNLRTGGRIELAGIVLATALSVAGLATAPVHAAPVHPVPDKKADDNLVDPNEEPSANDGSKPAVSIGPLDPALVTKGLATYKSYCQKCHGLDMVTPGGGFFDLRTFPLDDKPRFVHSVTEGKRAMPAWGSVLKPADIDALWAYVANYQVSKAGGKP